MQGTIIVKTTSEMVRVTAAGGSMPAFVARPDVAGKFPAVIVVMEAFGLNEHIKDVACRIAAEGYFVLAPDMYYREKGGVVGYDQLPEAIRLMMTLEDDKIVADVDAVVRYLGTRDAVRSDRIGITGFCMGGRISFLAACRCPGLVASAPFYGGGIGSLIDQAPKLACPALLFFGDKDDFIPNDEVEKIRATLAALKKDATVKVYSGAQHGFFCNERPSYDSEAARDAWQRLLRFFEKHLRS